MAPCGVILAPRDVFLRPFGTIVGTLGLQFGTLGLHFRVFLSSRGGLGGPPGTLLGNKEALLVGGSTICFYAQAW